MEASFTQITKTHLKLVRINVAWMTVNGKWCCVQPKLMQNHVSQCKNANQYFPKKHKQTKPFPKQQPIAFPHPQNYHIDPDCIFQKASMAYQPTKANLVKVAYQTANLKHEPSHGCFVAVGSQLCHRAEHPTSKDLNLTRCHLVALYRYSRLATSQG